jgi:hypothetical protein
MKFIEIRDLAVQAIVYGFHGTTNVVADES